MAKKAIKVALIYGGLWIVMMFILTFVHGLSDIPTDLIPTCISVTVTAGCTYYIGYKEANKDAAKQKRLD